MKHLLSSASFLPLIWALTAGCSGATEEQTSPSPWSDLSFFNRKLTTMTLVNTSEDTLWYYNRELQDEFYRGGSEGALLEGDSVVFPMKLWRPECTYLYLEGRSSIKSHLFPGFNRTLVWKNGFINRGPHATTIYDPMMLLDHQLKQQGPSTPITATTEDILAYYQEKTDYFDRVSDSLTSTKNYPDWVPDMLRRQAHLIAAGEVETIRGYRRMAYLDTFDLPQPADYRIDSLLSDMNNVSAPNYRSLLNRRMFVKLSAVDSIPSPNGATNGLIRQWLTKNFLSTNPGMLAAFLEGEIHSSRQYRGKDDLIESGIASLPPDYQIYLTELQQTLAEGSSNDSATLSLLATTFQSPDDKFTKLPEAQDGELLLHKFWFPGCAPCVRQYPHEKLLLEEFPDLRLIYIGYITTPTAWADYVADHDLPTNQQYFLPNKKNQLAKDALGILGAPRYVLTSGGTKILCRVCPKPDDPSLHKLIQLSLKRTE